MGQNLGVVDRFFRVVMGVVGLVAGFLNQSMFWTGVGLAVMMTGLFGYCPVYEILGLKDSRL